MTGSVRDVLGELPGVAVVTEPHRVRLRSRDFYWYSPILKRRFAGCSAEAIVEATDEDDVLDTLRACFRHRVPVTVRGRGTGNYGQAVPMAGGIVLDVSGMSEIFEIRKGAVLCQPGLVMGQLDETAQAESGQEMRIHPSTRDMASIGGFVAGGSSGVGSCTWGTLREPGNVIGLRVVTMEDEPRILDLSGDELHKVLHAYGTNGVITRVEMPLAPARPWVDVAMSFDDLMAAVRFADRLMHRDGIIKKLVSVIAGPVPQQYFRDMSPVLEDGRHLVLLMIAAESLDAFTRFAADAEGDVSYRSDRTSLRLPPLFEYSWNHTTLHALKFDRGITYLQSLFPPGRHVERVEAMHARFGDEVPMHVEFAKLDGKVCCFGLQLVRYTADERLAEIMALHEEAGVPIFNPHAYTIEEGGMKRVDHAQLAFKREADPLGLMNPHKMLAFDDPDAARGLAQNAFFR